MHICANVLLGDAERRKRTFSCYVKRLSNKYGENSKNDKFNENHLEKGNGEVGLREVRKFRKNRKSNKTFSCYVNRLSNKYGENSKNDKFNKILH